MEINNCYFHTYSNMNLYPEIRSYQHYYDIINGIIVNNSNSSTKYFGVIEHFLKFPFLNNEVCDLVTNNTTCSTNIQESFLTAILDCDKVNLKNYPHKFTYTSNYRIITNQMLCTMS